MIQSGKPKVTSEQRSVIRLESGPARVLAGAGSGKTFTMTEFVARKIRDHREGDGGFAPERILAITFTVKAAEEMRDRLKNRLELPQPRFQPRPRERDRARHPA